MAKLFIFAIIAIGVSLQFADVDADGKADAKKAFEELVKVLDKAITDGEKVIDKAVGQFNSTADKLEVKAKSDLNKLLSPLQKKLDELVKKAGEKGKKCKKFVDDFSKIPDGTVKGIVDCVRTQVNAVQTAASDALQQMRKIVKDLKSIGPEIDKCTGSKVDEAKCYAKLIAKIVKDAKTAPVKISADVAKVTLLISKLLPTLESCLANQLRKAGSEGAADIAKFGVCAAVK
ncbi:uncharacterized protein LOC109536201 [Dendroctonus ponderosae]